MREHVMSKDRGSSSGSPGLSVLVEEAVPRAVQQDRRAVARTRDAIALLQRRPDLVGVYAPADLAAEAVRWSA